MSQSLPAAIPLSVLLVPCSPALAALLEGSTACTNAPLPTLSELATWSPATYIKNPSIII